ncbi:hypothetical protein B0T11DRAFT_276324 [Plectosphaerella cucumerina]|uniref:Uncharacterized protein n=1 Tax=Plectosphaerella cucumerina TaxID=40658 RepID=A0A8K0X5P1_9PEZI|nr:hypothetical protein B0T11DRAFT_276324 [Plectosphaerella cucumerina]
MSTIATSAPQPTKTEEGSPTPDATKPPLYRVCHDDVCRSPTPEEKKEMDIEWNKVDWNWMPKHLKDYMESMETATATADAPTPTGLEKRGKIDQNWKGRWDEKWSDGIERYQSDRSKPIDFSLLPECLRYCFNKFNKHAPGDIFKESVGDFCGMPKLAVWNTWFDFGPGYCVSEKGRCSNYDSAMSRDWYFKNCGH